MFRSAYSEPKKVRQHVGEHSMTQQSAKDECDVNKIMARYQKDQLITHVNQYQGQYGDFTGTPDFHEAIDRVREAHEMFMTLPAKVRKEFDNDPGAFLDFVQDPENAEEMRELGLLPKERRVDAPEKPAEGKIQTPEGNSPQSEPKASGGASKAPSA